MSAVKAGLRRRLRRILERTSEEAFAQAGRKAAALLVERPEYQRAATVMVFLSRPGETDTSELVRRCFEDGKRVVAPRVNWEAASMTPVALTDVALAEVRKYGVPEPPDGGAVSLAETDLILAPGLGFDENGARIGRGGGYYDRFLASADACGLVCGFALEAQMVERVPTEPHDIRVDLLVTEVRVRAFPRSTEPTS